MKHKGQKIQSFICHFYLIILTIIAIFPLVWIILSSIKGKGELTGNPTGFLPKTFTLEYFRHVIFDLGFINNIKNSAGIALVTTLIAIIVAALAAYGIVRFFPKFGSVMSKVLVTTYIFPPILLAIPYSIVMAKAGLVNTRIGLIIVYLSFSIPYAVWLLVGFFKSVPIGIEEAARIDGANKIKVFGTVVLPLVAPGIVATAIYTFINAWNEYTVALTLISTDVFKPLTVGITIFNGYNMVEWQYLFASSLFATVPVIILFVLIEKHLVGGLTSGGVKG